MTPHLTLDPDLLEANLAAMADSCAEAGVALRPHVKGHKSAWIAQRQCEHGAVGVATATLREAAAMLDGGIGDVLLTSVIAPGALGDALALARRAPGSLTLVVHTPELVRTLDAEAEEPVDVLLDLDVGQRRGGATPGPAALAVATAVAGSTHVRLLGVQGYEGHLQAVTEPEVRAAASRAAMALLTGAVAELRSCGHAVPWVTTAGTGTAAFAAAQPVVTEVQPGSYALMDAAYVRVGGVSYAQAVHVVATVTAVLSADEVILDAGLKALSTDAGPAAVADIAGARYEPAGDEHGRLLGPVAHLRAGDEVRLVPSHSDTTVLLHDAFVLPGGERVPVSAR